MTSLINTPGRHYQLFTPRPTPTHKGKSAPGRSTDSLILAFQAYGGKLNFLLMYGIRLNGIETIEVSSQKTLM